MAGQGQTFSERAAAGTGLTPPPSLNQPHPSMAPTATQSEAPTGAHTPRTRAGPTGGTPQAKRPMTRESVQISETGQRLMSVEDLSAGFHNLHNRMEREGIFTQTMHAAVDHNAQLLDHLLQRIQTIEQVQGAHVLKMDLTDEFMAKHVKEVENVLEIVHAKDVAADTKLRNEMDSCTERIDKSYSELRLRLDRIENEITQYRATAEEHQQPPGLQPTAALGEGMRALTQTVDTISERILNTEAVMSRHEATIKEAANNAYLMQQEFHVTADRVSSMGAKVEDAIRKAMAAGAQATAAIAAVQEVSQREATQRPQGDPWQSRAPPMPSSLEESRI